MHRCNWNRQTRQMQNPLRLLLPLWRKCLIYPSVRQLNMYVPPRCPSDFSDRTSGVRLKNINAGVMELADVTDSKSVGLITRVGSSPTTGTIKSKRYRCHWRKASGINRFRAFSARKFTDDSIDANRCFPLTGGIRTPSSRRLATPETM